MAFPLVRGILLSAFLLMAATLAGAAPELATSRFDDGTEVRDGQRGGQKVLHLITLGTPHHGTPLADAAIVLGQQALAELDDYPQGLPRIRPLAGGHVLGLGVLCGHRQRSELCRAPPEVTRSQARSSVLPAGS